MSSTVYYICCLILAGGVLGGISMMSRVNTAVKGNLLSAGCTAVAILITLYRNGLLSSTGLWVSMAIGLVLGLTGAAKVKMIEMPQAVALLNGFGGAASAFVAMVSILEGQIHGGFASFTAGLAMVIGITTLVGSLIAAGKLHRLINQRPVIWPGHSVITALSLCASLAAAAAGTFGILSPALLVLLACLFSAVFGTAFAIRVGGADMPITISLLNSLSGVAGAIAGMAISDPLLVAIGGIVGASGLILTQIMCRAMNRKLLDILLGKTGAPAKKKESVTASAADKVKAEKNVSAADHSAAAQPENTCVSAQGTELSEPSVSTEPADAEPVKAAIPAGRPADPEAGPAETAGPDLPSILRNARNVIIVPGYGMALAQAQSLVKSLEDKLEANGARVRYAIHPVAGRMPGHMNVLLAEADVDYDKLFEMENINDDFADCDLAVVIGANDVVNPAANTAEGTPIYGMPVLNVADAKHIVFCNYDLKPGYAGVENPLYKKESGITLMLGDAKDSLRKILEMLSKPVPDDEPAGTAKCPEDLASSDVSQGYVTGDEPAAETEDTSGSNEKAVNASGGKPAEDPLPAILRNARNVIIVPGYGMALAQAQSLVKNLEDKLEANGAEVRYAIHPVAGRMPGHMNVLLAEADVDYDKLFEMDDINPEFENCDLAVVIGANDVINPAANTAEGTPIYGMPVLDVAKAKHIIICNYDLKPGYAGVENPLYQQESGVSILPGDAKDSLNKLLGMLG